MTTMTSTPRNAHLADWTVLDYPVVDDACRRAASRATQNPLATLELDDMLQEARIWCALNSEQVMSYVNTPSRTDFLANRIYSRVWGRIKTEMGRAEKQINIDRLAENDL